MCPNAKSNPTNRCSMAKLVRVHTTEDLLQVPSEKLHLPPPYHTTAYTENTPHNIKTVYTCDRTQNLT